MKPYLISLFLVFASVASAENIILPNANSCESAFRVKVIVPASLRLNPVDILMIRQESAAMAESKLLIAKYKSRTNDPNAHLSIYGDSPYIKSQVKFALQKLIPTIEFDLDMQILKSFLTKSFGHQLKYEIHLEKHLSTLESLPGFGDTAVQRAEKIIENSIDIAEVVDFLLTVDLVRSLRTSLDDLKLKNDMVAEDQASFEVSQAFTNYALAKDGFKRQLQDGHIFLPTFALLSKGYFTGTWPLLRPIGLSPTDRIGFDEEFRQLPIRFSAHDIIDHYALTQKLDPGVILKITEAQEILFAKMAQLHPEHIELIKERMFHFMHELSGYGAVYNYVIKKDEFHRWNTTKSIENNIFLCGIRCEDQLKARASNPQDAAQFETIIRKNIFETYLDLLK